MIVVFLFHFHTSILHSFEPKKKKKKKRRRKIKENKMGEKRKTSSVVPEHAPSLQQINTISMLFSHFVPPPLSHFHIYIQY